MEVVLGENDARLSIDCDSETCAEPPQRFFVADVFQHQLFMDPPFANDIAIIRLDRPVEYTGESSILFYLSVDYTCHIISLVH